MYCWILAWRILSITLLAYEMSEIVWQFELSLPLPFFEIGMKTDLFQSYGHCWDFQICWHIECSTFTASSFRIWNSSTGIPSPPLPWNFFPFRSSSQNVPWGNWITQCRLVLCNFSLTIYKVITVIIILRLMKDGCKKCPMPNLKVMPNPFMVKLDQWNRSIEHKGKFRLDPHSFI